MTSRTINAFLSRLSIATRVNSRLVGIVFEARDPQLAAKVANTMARIYATQNVELRVNPFQETADLFGVRLDEQRRRVEESELALQQYLEKHDVAPLTPARASSFKNAACTGHSRKRQPIASPAGSARK